MQQLRRGFARIRFYVGLGFINMVDAKCRESEQRAMAIVLASFDGATIYPCTYGGWRETSNKQPEFERGLVIEVLTEDTSLQTIDEVAMRLAHDFNQRTVLISTENVAARFVAHTPEYQAS